MNAKVCDRYRTAKDVQSYELLLETWDEDPNHDPKPIIKRIFDLSPRGLEFVKHFIEKGIAKLEAKPTGEAK